MTDTQIYLHSEPDDVKLTRYQVSLPTDLKGDINNDECRIRAVGE
ncbi:hypothetical protein PQQ53_19135 [Paraburkholderia strydomiana]|jgi:hypothetical protein|uniref:Uncharacterized protein n=1 Tax=Paraburkholderia strydomiana TaxID=1245417 RepID=A0ABW9EEG5_9BURK